MDELETDSCRVAGLTSMYMYFKCSAFPSFTAKAVSFFSDRLERFSCDGRSLQGEDGGKRVTSSSSFTPSFFLQNFWLSPTDKIYSSHEFCSPAPCYGFFLPHEFWLPPTTVLAISPPGEKTVSTQVLLSNPLPAVQELIKFD